MGDEVCGGFPTLPAPLALVTVAGRRWGVEGCFESGKNAAGPDHYQVRLHRAWQYRNLRDGIDKIKTIRSIFGAILGPGAWPRLLRIAVRDRISPGPGSRQSPIDDNDLILVSGWRVAGVGRVGLGVDDRQMVIEADGGRRKLEGVVCDDTFDRPGP